MGLYTASMKRVREIAKRREGQSMWTKEKPKEAGYYWHRDHTGNVWMYPVIRGTDGICCVMLTNSPDPLTQRVCITQVQVTIAFDGEWLGPLRPDEGAR